MININSKMKKLPTVMIIDDDISSRMLLRASVSLWGYPVVEAKDGEEAFAMLNDQDPKILIIDWLMPKMDGIELCSLIQKSFKHRPYTIVLTHNKGTVNLVNAIESGADEFIEKPVNLEELRCRLIVGTRILNSEYITFPPGSQNAR